MAFSTVIFPTIIHICCQSLANYLLQLKREGKQGEQSKRNTCSEMLQPRPLFGMSKVMGHDGTFEPNVLFGWHDSQLCDFKTDSQVLVPERVSCGYPLTILTLGVSVWEDQNRRSDVKSKGIWKMADVKKFSLYRFPMFSKCQKLPTLAFQSSVCFRGFPKASVGTMKQSPQLKYCKNHREQFWIGCILFRCTAASANIQISIMKQ